MLKDEIAKKKSIKKGQENRPWSTQVNPLNL
jgi:hypothetical protein